MARWQEGPCGSGWRQREGTRAAASRPRRPCRYRGPYAAWDGGTGGTGGPRGRNGGPRLVHAHDAHVPHVGAHAHVLGNGAQFCHQFTLPDGAKPADGARRSTPPAAGRPPAARAHGRGRWVARIGLKVTREWARYRKTCRAVRRGGLGWVG